MPVTETLSVIAVARRAGVSVGTVSRVINGHPKVLPINVAAVQQAMTQIGYRPLAPENRRGRRSRRRIAPGANINLLLIGPHDLKWMADHSPVYSHVIHGIQRALAEHNIDLVVRHVPTYAQLATLLRANPPDGLLLFGSEPGDALPAELQRTPAVWVMGSPRGFHGDHVMPNHLRIGTLAAEYLHANGHERCAFLGYDLDLAHADIIDGAHRGIAFLAATARLGGHALTVPHADLYDHQRNRTNEAVLSARLDGLFAAKHPPTALFLGLDSYAPSVYRHLLSRGIRPGRDVAIVTCNNERPFLAGLDPMPAVIDLQADQIGHRTVERLLWRIAHPHEAAEEIMVAPRLIPPEESDRR